MTRIALTGTPGTGKTTVADRLDVHLEVVHLAEVIASEGLALEHDPVRDTDVIDLDALQRVLADRDDVVFESHLAHHLPVDVVIVLRCHPDVLEDRLRRRDVPERSIRENAESEALDVILTEAVNRHGREVVGEVDTTNRSVDDVVSAVEAVIRGEEPLTIGQVDFTEYL